MSALPIEPVPPTIATCMLHRAFPLQNLESNKTQGCFDVKAVVAAWTLKKPAFAGSANSATLPEIGPTTTCQFGAVSELGTRSPPARSRSTPDAPGWNRLVQNASPSVAPAAPHPDQPEGIRKDARFAVRFGHNADLRHLAPIRNQGSLLHPFRVIIVPAEPPATDQRHAVDIPILVFGDIQGILKLPTALGDDVQSEEIQGSGLSAANSNSTRSTPAAT